MTLQPYYQVIVLGAGEGLHGAALRDAVRARAAEIGPEVLHALQFLDAGQIGGANPKLPTVAVFLGGDTTTHASQADELIAKSIPTLPTVEDLQRYSALVPPSLRPVNGMEIDWAVPSFVETANLVLENLSLLRRTRRLFLSYLRKESTAVAHQLRVAFDDAGYDAFLDTSSVPKGDDFQAVLWHRLLDSDVLVVLDTPNFMSSIWTQEEIAQASAMTVGIVRVVWPGSSAVPKADLAQQVHLEAKDFIGDALTDNAIARIVKETEALRARCIAARHTNLILEFCEEANRIGATTAVQPGRYVLALLPDGRRVAAIPAVGVLDANRYHEAHTRFPAAGSHADLAVLIYDHRGLMPAWTDFLTWLDLHLPVRSLRVTETAATLGAV